MLDRGKIIQTVLLKLGNTTDYNDNEEKEYKIANLLLDDVIREVKINQNYLFNAVEVKLNRAEDGVNHRDEYKYHEPVGWLNFVNRPQNVRKIGKFIFSKEEEVYITYCKEIQFTEIPLNMENVLIYSLAFAMTSAFPQYAKRKGEFEGMLLKGIEEVKISEPVEVRNILEEIQEPNSLYPACTRKVF